MLALILAALLTGPAAAQPGASLQAAALVGRAFDAVAARPQRGLEPERRRLEVMDAGRALLGPGFNVTETAAILALMEDWLKRSPDAGREEGSVDELLAQAARSAHPQIRDGKGTRGARNWARFVRALSGSGAKG
jgi:hypothetical protein